MRKRYVLVGFTAVAVIIASANFHVVTGSEVSGIRLEKKPSMTLSETFVNLDSVGNMPMIAARAQYPMYVAKVERRMKAAIAQASNGCRNIYVGMLIGEIIPKCGQPDSLKTLGADAEMRWETGVHIKTSGDKVVFVNGN